MNVYHYAFRLVRHPILAFEYSAPTQGRVIPLRPSSAYSKGFMWCWFGRCQRVAGLSGGKQTNAEAVESTPKAPTVKEGQER